MIDGDRTIAGFVFSVPSRHGKINELLKQLCNQFHICFKNETYKSYEKNITENGKCGDRFVTHKIVYGPSLRSIYYFVGDRPVHKLPFGPKCHELFVILY
jgi:hypothetical protein